MNWECFTNSPSKIEGVPEGRGSMTGDEIIPLAPLGRSPCLRGRVLPAITNFAVLSKNRAERQRRNSYGNTKFTV